MTDIACWRLNRDQVVIRVRGSEYTFEDIEAMALASHIDNVLHYGKKESLGEEYQALRSRPKLPADKVAMVQKLASVFGPWRQPKGTFRR